MNLYVISQDVNNDYDTFSDAVVAATSEANAKLIHPAWGVTDWSENDTWAQDPTQVKVTLIGTATDDIKENSVILASFHAG